MAKIEIEVIQHSTGIAVWAADRSEQFFSVPSGTSIETIFLCLDAYHLGKAKALSAPFAPQDYQVVHWSIAIEKWEDELDQLGPFASQDALQAHLEKAPANAPSRDYLAQVVAGLK